MANTSKAQSPIGNGQTLNADAALYWTALVADLEERTGTRVIATEGTRTYARQKQLYDGYMAGATDPTTGRRYNPAWSPDSPRANHLAGRAVDVGSGVGYVGTDMSKAFYSIAGAYGFKDTVKGEPWHFEWDLSRVSASVRARVEAQAIEKSEEDELTPEEKNTLANIAKWAEATNHAAGRQERRQEQILCSLKLILDAVNKTKVAVGKLVEALITKLTK